MVSFMGAGQGLVSLAMFRIRETKKSELPVLAIDLGDIRIFTAIISDKGQGIAEEGGLRIP